MQQIEMVSVAASHDEGGVASVAEGVVFVAVSQDDVGVACVFMLQGL